VDGVWDIFTEKAVKAFQITIGLPDTGKLDGGDLRWPKSLIEK
jgi:hypothetical protein